ncbi:hypothetical protein JXA88_19130, partial [Candidatus Fermentibacteria bacterium]|nr:hypothetical protein [Candidatus Fermentibacteria bacterium]
QGLQETLGLLHGDHLVGDHLQNLPLFVTHGSSPFSNFPGRARALLPRDGVEFTVRLLTGSEDTRSSYTSSGDALSTSCATRMAYKGNYSLVFVNSYDHNVQLSLPGMVAGRAPIGSAGKAAAGSWHGDYGGGDEVLSGYLTQVNARYSSHEVRRTRHSGALGGV